MTGSKLLGDIKANAEKIHLLAQALGKGAGAEEQMNAILQHTQQMMRELHEYRKYAVREQQ